MANSRNFLNGNNVLRVLGRNAATSGSTVLTSNIDTRGYRRITAMIDLASGTTGGVITARYQHSATTATGDFVNADGAVITITHTAAATKSLRPHFIEVINPTKRYGRIKINPTVDPVLINSVNVIRGDPDGQPVAQETGVVTVTVVSPGDSV